MCCILYKIIDSYSLLPNFIFSRIPINIDNYQYCQVYMCICRALVLSDLGYCCSSWSSGLNKIHIHFKFCQNKYALLILNMDARGHIGTEHFNYLACMVKCTDQSETWIFWEIKEADYTSNRTNCKSTRVNWSHT